MSWKPMTVIRGMVSWYCSFFDDRWIKLYMPCVEKPVMRGRTTVNSARDCEMGRERKRI
jgi:hypothetical protein